MTLFDLKASINKENNFIKNIFPLKYGGFNFDLDHTYNITSKILIINRYWH